MNALTSLAAVAAMTLAGAVALAQDPQRWTNLEDGVRAGKKSGRPVLVVTIWNAGVCNTCDTWRDRVPKDADVAKQVPRFEQVEWHYDGLSGKVIPWTRQHGGTSDDPAVQAFVVAPDTGEVARAPRETVYAPSQFAKWLKEQADAFDKSHPATKVPFVAAEVAAVQDGTGTKWSCAAIDEARAAARPVLVCVSRSDRPDADKPAKLQAAASRKMEKTALDSADVAKSLEGWTLLRLDLSDADHAAYAKTLGAEKAPALIAIVPGEEKPQALDTSLAADALAFRIRKLVAPKK
jgi:hypothetical protein